MNEYWVDCLYINVDLYILTYRSYCSLRHISFIYSLRNKLSVLLNCDKPFSHNMWLGSRLSQWEMKNVSAIDWKTCGYLTRIQAPFGLWSFIFDLVRTFLGYNKDKQEVLSWSVLMFWYFTNAPTHDKTCLHDQFPLVLHAISSTWHLLSANVFYSCHLSMILIIFYVITNEKGKWEIYNYNTNNCTTVAIKLHSSIEMCRFARRISVLIYYLLFKGWNSWATVCVFHNLVWSFTVLKIASNLCLKREWS